MKTLIYNSRNDCTLAHLPDQSRVARVLAQSPREISDLLAHYRWSAKLDPSCQ